jgi:hypothetical protein
VTIEVRRVKTLSDDEKRQLFGWGTDVFGARGLNLRLREPEYHIVVYDDGRAAAKMSVCRQAVKVNVRWIGIHRWRPRRLARWVYELVNRDVPSIMVGGGGGFVAPPTSGAPWYAAFAHRHAVKMVRDEWGLDFFLGFCLDRMVPNYERIHAQVIPGPVYIDQPAGKVRCPINTMVICLRKKPWPPGIVDIGGLPW